MNSQSVLRPSLVRIQVFQSPQDCHGHRQTLSYPPKNRSRQQNILHTFNTAESFDHSRIKMAPINTPQRPPRVQSARSHPFEWFDFAVRYEPVEAGVLDLHLIHFTLGKIVPPVLTWHVLVLLLDGLPVPFRAVERNLALGAWLQTLTLRARDIFREGKIYVK